MAEAPRIKQTVRIDLVGLKEMETLISNLRIATAEMKELAAATLSAKTHASSLSKSLSTLSVSSTNMSRKVGGMLTRLTNLMNGLNSSGVLATNAFNQVGTSAANASANAAAARQNLTPSQPRGGGGGQGRGRNRRRLPFSISFSGLFLNPRFGATLTAGIAALATAFYALRRAIQSVFKPAVEFQQGMAHVSRTTKIVGEELKVLTKRMSAVAAATGSTHANIAKIGEVAGQLGVKGVENVTEFVRVVATMERVTDLTADKAAKAIAKVAQAFSLPITKAENIGSVINELANNTTAAASEIVQALGKIGPVAANLNIPLSTTAAMLTTLIDTGLVAPRAGTNLRNLLILIQAKAGKVARLMNTTAQEFTDRLSQDAGKALSDYFDRLRSLTQASFAGHVKDVFGQENFAAIDTLATLYHEFAKANVLAKDAFREKVSMSQEYARMMNTVQGQWDLFKSTLNDILIMLGTKLLPAVQDFLESITYSISRLEVNLERLHALSKEYQLATVVEAFETFGEKFQGEDDVIAKNAEATKNLAEATERLAEARENLPDFEDLQSVLDNPRLVVDSEGAVEQIMKQHRAVQVILEDLKDERAPLVEEQFDLQNELLEVRAKYDKALAEGDHDEMAKRRQEMANLNAQIKERSESITALDKRIEEQTRRDPYSGFTREEFQNIRDFDAAAESLEHFTEQAQMAQDEVNKLYSEMITLVTKMVQVEGMEIPFFQMLGDLEEVETPSQARTVFRNFIDQVAEGEKGYISVKARTILGNIDFGDMLEDGTLGEVVQGFYDSIEKSIATGYREAMLADPRLKNDIGEFINEVNEAIAEGAEGLDEAKWVEFLSKHEDSFKALDIDTQTLWGLKNYREQYALLVEQFLALADAQEVAPGEYDSLPDPIRQRLTNLSDLTEKAFAQYVTAENKAISASNRQIETNLARMHDLELLRQEIIAGDTGMVFFEGRYQNVYKVLDDIESKLKAVVQTHLDLVEIQRDNIAFANKLGEAMGNLGDVSIEMDLLANIQTDVGEFLDIVDLDLRKMMQDRFQYVTETFLDPEKIKKVALGLEDIVDYDGGEGETEEWNQFRELLAQALVMFDSNETDKYLQENLNAYDEWWNELINQLIQIHQREIDQLAKELMDKDPTLQLEDALDLAAAEIPVEDFFTRIEDHLPDGVSIYDVLIGDREAAARVREEMGEIEESIDAQLYAADKSITGIIDLYDALIESVKDTVDGMRELISEFSSFGKKFLGLSKSAEDTLSSLSNVIQRIGDNRILNLEVQQFEDTSARIREFEEVFNLDGLRDEFDELQRLAVKLEQENTRENAIKTAAEMSERLGEHVDYTQVIVDKNRELQEVSDRRKDTLDEIIKIERKLGRPEGKDASPFQLAVSQFTELVGIADFVVTAGQALSELVFGSEKSIYQREKMMQLERENARRLEQAVRTLSSNLRDVTGERTGELAGALQQYIQHLEDLGSELEGMTLDQIHAQYVRGYGTDQELNTLLARLRVELESVGLLQEGDAMPTISELRDILEGVVGSGGFDETLNGLMNSLDFLTQFIDLNAVDAMRRFIAGLLELEQVPDWLKDTLAGVDLSTEEGQLAFRELLQGWALDFAEGRFDVTELGGLTPEEFKEMMDYLLGLADQAGEESGITTIGIDRVITDVQANQVIALLEQQVYYAKESYKLMKDAAPPVDVGSVADTAPPIQPKAKSGYAVNFNGDIVMDLQYDPDDPAFAKAAGEALREHLLKYQGRSR